MDDAKVHSLSGRIARGMRGISFQLAVLLSFAVLPIGAVAIWQSMEFAHQTRRLAETLLLGITAENVDLERRLIEGGLAAAPSFDAQAVLTEQGLAQCIKALSGFVAENPAVRSVSFVPLDGQSRCASDGQKRDLSADAAHLRFLARPVQTVDRFASEDSSVTPYLQVLQPVRVNGTLLGYHSLVLQSFRFAAVPNRSGVPNPQEVVLFNAAGNLLNSTLDSNDAAARLPQGGALGLLLQGPDGFAQGSDQSGLRSGFVKVTLIPHALLAIGIWPQDNPVSQSDHALPNAVTFPLLMWVFSMTVAFVAARRLVIRPIKMLRDEIRRFALGQRNAAIVLAPGAALEIQETVNTFNKLKLIVAHNEAVLELTAEGKLLLLREVHHRIKNNLQMISSIISIQRRKTTDPQVELVLRSLRDRVLSIAAVDQSLYTNGDVLDVRADLLIASITDRLVGVNLEPGHGVRITTRFETVMLHADQIGPLSLMANEGVTNALKYVGKPAEGPPSIDIALTWDADWVHLSIENSLQPDLKPTDEDRERTRLGMVLISAFADQLGASVQSGPDPDGRGFHLSVRFRPNAPPMAENPLPSATNAF